MSHVPAFSTPTCFLLALTQFWLLSLSARAQDPAAAQRQVTVTPVNVIQHVPVRFQAGTDDPIPLPPHPPIDQIPPMPMPTRDPNRVANPNATSTTTWHDARTGETRVIPQSVFRMDPESSGQGGEGYPGVEGEDYSDEMMRGFGTMAVSGTATTWPRRGNCKLVMHFVDQCAADRWFVCSGTMADPGVVLTAAHCVYARDVTGCNIYDWASEIYVYPGWDGVTPNATNTGPDSDDEVQNWGWSQGDYFLAGTAYIDDGDSDRDVGVIRLGDSNPSNDCDRSVGMLTSWFGWAWGGSCGDIKDRTYGNYSYPSENCSATLHTGATLYYWDGDVDSCPDNQLQIDTGSGCTTAVWGGMSGSGMYYREGDNRYVHAVCSTSDRSSSGWYCELWEQFVNDMQDFEDDTRTTDCDFESLMFRDSGSSTVAAGSSMAACTVQICNATDHNPSAANFTLDVYLSSNNNITDSDTLLNTWDYDSVNFGDIDCRQFNVPAPTIPSNTAPGTYWVGVILDAPASIDVNTCNNDSDTWDAQKITVYCHTLSAPSNVSATNNLTTRVRVTWNAVSYADDYKVYRNILNNAGSATLIATTSNTSYNDYTATPGTVYHYWVKAKNDCGEESGYSSSDTGERVEIVFQRYAFVSIFQVASRQRAPEDCLQPGSGTNDILTVSLDMTGAPVPIVGGQFFLEYDNTMLDFLTATPGEPPFVREIYADLDEANGTIDYVTGIEDGDVGTTADRKLAVLTFRVVAEDCGATTSVAFRNHYPPSRLGDENDGEVLLVGENLVPIAADSTPPDLTVPPAISVNADAGECSATFTTLPMATATDNCDPEVDVSFSRTDGRVQQLDPYDAADSPIGITWYAKDDCGNTAIGTQVITVSGQTELRVDVELSPMLDDPQPTVPGDQLFRCITFELSECPDGDVPSAAVEQVMGFSVDAGFPHRVVNFPLLVPCGNYTCATARDRLHTLRSTAPDFTDNGTSYSATFVGNRANDGHWLVGGNLNDDEFIDILDFASYIVRFGLVYNSRHTDCETPFYHADITGNGIVFTDDFTFIAVNFLKFHEPNCCFDPTSDFPHNPDGTGTEASRAAGGPLAEVSVADLWRLGLGELSAADLNRDGLVNTVDMAIFAGWAGMDPNRDVPLERAKGAARPRAADPRGSTP